MFRQNDLGIKKLNHKNKGFIYLFIFFLIQIIICGISLFKLGSIQNAFAEKDLNVAETYQMYSVFSNGISCINLLLIIILFISIAGISYAAYVFTRADSSVNSKESADHVTSDDNKKVISSELFSEFIKRTGTLTHTERIIFDHYLEGKSGKEIAQILGISTNTLKVHNNHIYKKLNITSREELSLYIDLITKSGMLSQIVNNS